MRNIVFFLFLFFKGFALWGMETSFDFTGLTPTFVIGPTGMLRPPDPVINPATGQARGTKRTRSEAGLSLDQRHNQAILSVVSVAAPRVPAPVEAQEAPTQSVQTGATLTYQALPADTQAHIMSFLSPDSLDVLRQVSQDQRVVANSLRRVLRIPLSDLIRTHLWGPYNHVTHLTLTRHALSQRCLNARQVLLIAQHFPYLSHLSLSGLGITLDAFHLLTRHTSFNNLRELDISHNRLTNEHFEYFRDAVFNDTLEVLNASDTQATADALRILAQRDTLANLRVLDVSRNAFGAEGFEALARASFSTCLGVLRISRVALDTHSPNTLRAFEQLTRNFKRLRTLDISYNMLNDALISLLGTSIFAPYLEELCISGNNITHLLFESWRKSQAFSRLRILRASGGAFGTVGVRALVGCAFVNRLEILSLGFSNLAAESIQELANGNFVNLYELVLASNAFGNEGLQSLINSKFSSQLRILNMAHTGITSTGALLIRNNNAFERLISLTIGGNVLGDAGFIDLASTRFAPNLETLFINSAYISPHGMQTIAALQAFPRLTSLDFAGNPNSALNWLAQTAFASHLIELSLNYTNITPGVLEYLTGQNAFSSLRVLNIAENPLVANGLRLLSQASFARNLRVLNLNRTGTSTAFTAQERNRILRESFPSLQVYGYQ